jgi:TonB family protein
MAPRRFGRYEVQREIGEGAMGRVYRCLDPLMKRVVAAKTVKKEFLTRDTREEYLRRFRREAQAAGRLAHPNIVSVFDVGDDYFVMEYLEGSTLQVILRDRGQLPADEALRILEPLAEALDYAHRSGIIHRDIKPGNVFVLADGRPKLMDFGVAHLESSAMTAQGHFFGSPSYMAPEQMAGGQVMATADLFSFAVVAYEMITGHRPFEGASITAIMYRVVHEDAPPPRQWDFDLPPAYDDIFGRALSKTPGERFPDAASLVRALERREFIASTAAAAADALSELEETLNPSAARALAASAAWAPARFPTAAVDAMETTDLQSVMGVSTSPARTSRRAWWGLAGALAVAVIAAIFLGRATEPTLPPPASVRPSGLRIETDPPGAAVLLDGEKAGVSPLALSNVRPGVHMVKVARAGYAPAGLTLEIRKDEPPPPLRFVMEPLTAKLRVRSEPSEAVVRVDGEAVGTTPMESFDLVPGRHEIRLERHGYLPGGQSVEGRVGQTVDLSLRLEREHARADPPLAPGTHLAEGELVHVDPSVVPARRIKGDAPSYPEEGRKLSLQGTVAVDMLVDETGTVQDPHIIESAGEVLDRAVLESVRRWRYEPARKNGVKVKTRIQVKTTFQAP